ncbi:hypothetical protein NEOLI_003314 [Neolecta irregularis DAH-3]|uniref:Zn(2)-C6 fungal-type domain-containing protein n=1 Tax=Neolecta irregularis (strain DAH-3) TaxID=1198029 RepID=A0A1U7LMS1_NEOID|nr:hypothetical protein NEOLI_003314 [Neolecta irregularis DAH-3]|eukprot:OLL23954.1 hypothetical protein NEOLI_003314 [Neolecta irregularis DAH-3]
MPSRRRAVTSCRNCIARRIKCDRHLPCEACMKKKYECSYEDLASVIKCDRDAFERIKQLQEENDKLKRLLEIANQDQGDESVNDTARLLGGLTFQEGRQRYHGFMPGNNAYRNVEDGLTSMLWKTPTFTSLLNVGQRYQLAEIAQRLLPSKDVAMILIDRYLRAHPGGFCHIHTPTFESDYLSMWHSNIACKDVLATTCRPFAFVVALAVFCSAMRTYSSSQDPALQAIEISLGVSRDEYRRVLQKGVNDAFRTGLYLENYDLDVVTALMINQANRDITSNCTLSSVSFVLTKSTGLVE